MTTICAWCQKTLKEDEPVQDHGLISHGICESCAAQVLRELEISKLDAIWRAS
jgi:hypothetical protein